MKKLLSFLTVFVLFATMTLAQNQVVPSKAKVKKEAVLNKVETKGQVAPSKQKVKDQIVPGKEKANDKIVESGPKMQFQEVEVDYGTIDQGGEPLRVFNFTNTGDEPLIISKAKGSCGCTVPKYPQEPILPGESAKIEVRYDTNRIGPFQKTVTLTTNESNPTHTLKIKGKVNPKPTKESVPASDQGFGKQ